jgi:hypothetical protein
MESIIPKKITSHYSSGYKRNYACLYDDDKFLTGMPLARLVMMNYLHCKKLPTKLYVHHINGNSMDDRIENLQLVTINIHASIHHPKDYKFGTSYTDNPTKYEQGRRKQPHVKKAINDSSLRWYHRNKEKVNSNPEKAIYKKEWYLKNKERITGKLKNRYDNDPIYRLRCLNNAKIQKQKRRERKNEAL